MRVGLLCSTSTQVLAFKPVMDLIQQQEGSCLWICLDNQLRWDAGSTLQAFALPYVLLGNDPDAERFTELPVLPMCRQLRKVNHQIETLYRRETLDLLIVGNDRGLIEKQFIRLSQQRGIPVLLLQDGVLWSSEVRSFRWHQRVDKSVRGLLRDLAKELLNRVLRVFGRAHLAPTYIGQGGCDAIAVMGEATKRLLVRRGVDPWRIVVTGQPRYDGVRNGQDLAHRVPSATARDAQRPFTLALFTSAFQVNMKNEELQTRQESFVNRLLSDLSQRPPGAILCLFKPHPREILTNYKLPDQSPNVQLVSARQSLDVIVQCDVVVTVPSTILVESCLFRKPLTLIDIGMGEMATLAESLGLSQVSFLHVSDPQQLIAHLEHSATAEAEFLQQEACTELLFLPAQSAAREVMVLIERLIGAPS